ncbi:MAG TPA: hypothetical protein VLW65_20390 [Bryobacteraceae bacterium]|nr:hypothetical protein [Bryobacteraceae bacterium]
MRVCILAFFVAAALCAESVAGLQWTAPAGWLSEGRRPMRAATYDIRPSASDRQGAECAVYYFGPHQGGSVEANVARWKGQFTHGGKVAPAEVRKRLIHGLAVTTIDTSGDYSGMGGPMAAHVTVNAGYRLLGAIIEGPEGKIFIKFTGPAKTVAANHEKFEELLASFQKQRR